MNEAVNEENYMEAARYRDEIKQLKEKVLEKKTTT
jgi:protein-arginine kinase activator protein McsA